MPLKLNVGLSKKIGQPDYGSRGASCNVEVELDANLLQTDLEGFRERVTRAFAACRQALIDELTRQQAGDANGSGNSRKPTGNRGRTNIHGNGPLSGQPAASSQRASAGQTEHIQQLAGQIRGLGVRKIDQLCQKMYSKPMVDLSGMDASGLIDTLRAIKEGKINVNDALSGATR